MIGRIKFTCPCWEEGGGTGGCNVWFPFLKFGLTLRYCFRYRAAASAGLPRSSTVLNLLDDGEESWGGGGRISEVRG